MPNSMNGDPSCWISVDCLDMGIDEPYPYEKVWSKRWYSQKENGAGLRYEIGVCIATGHIVWINGPFACGKYNDWEIFSTKGLKDHLDEFERVEADRGYAAGDPEFVKCKDSIFHDPSQRIVRNEIMACHETVNSRLKCFNILAKRYKHKLQDHQMVFLGVATLVQLSFESGSPPFEIKRIYLSMADRQENVITNMA